MWREGIEAVCVCVCVCACACVCVCVCYLGQVGLGHVVCEEPEPVEGLRVPGGRRSLAVALLVLMHHLGMQSLGTHPQITRCRIQYAITTK